MRRPQSTLPAAARSLRRAAAGGLDRVVEIERGGFREPLVAGPRRARARPRVVEHPARGRARRCARRSRCSGYVVFWLVHDEVHILNIATAIEARRRGVGRALMLRGARERQGARGAVATLEVRRSNVPAIALYRVARIPAGRRPAELLRRRRARTRS